jgi:hypothetical protein
VFGIFERKEGPMKKLAAWTTLFLWVILCSLAPVVEGAQTGKVEKNVYTDANFGFQITSLENWKAKTEKDPSLVRVVMTQKNYKTSSASGDVQYSAAIPTILILSDTTSLSLKEVEEILMGKGKLPRDKDRKEKILQDRDEFALKLDLVPNSEYLEIHDVTIDSVPARDYTLKQPYKKTGEDLRVKDPYNANSIIIQDFLAGHVILFKKDNRIYVVQFSCEREFFYPTNAEFLKIIGSWKFTSQAAP